jgi:hypothetical protein
VPEYRERYGRRGMSQKVADNLAPWARGEGIAFKNPEAEAAYRRRAGRIADVIQLRIPDRVPVVPSFGMFPFLDNGLTCEQAVHDYERASDAALKTLEEFEPDMFVGSGYALPASMFEALGYRQLRWPGRELPAHFVHQFVEDEYVKAEELYDHYLLDPSDFMLRVYLPRVCSNLAPLSRLRPLAESFGYYINMFSSYAFFGMPEVQDALQSLMTAGEECLKWAQVLQRQSKEIISRGFPLYTGGTTSAPYDLVGDWFRGTAGVMTDMFRHPDKLLAVMEKMVPIAVKMAKEPALASGHPVIGFMLHKGSDGFMSPEQFDRFYWPTLREVMIELIGEGLVPLLLFEGENTSRLETISDIPKGTCIYWFEKVDWARAKEVLGDTVCIRGGVSPSLLHSGSVSEVKARVKELIDVVGRDGGLIVDCGIWFDEAKHENVKAMVDFTKEYGIYG